MSSLLYSITGRWVIQSELHVPTYHHLTCLLLPAHLYHQIRSSYSHHHFYQSH